MAAYAKFNIETWNNQFELIHTGWFQSVDGQDIYCKFEGLTIIFRFIPPLESEKAKPVAFRAEADAKSVTLTLIFEGEVPLLPLAFATKQPMSVGLVNGVPLYF